MNCIVTAGPTFEPLDDVRRLTNFSTGRLGTELANFLTARGHAVTLLLGESATWTGERHVESTKTFATTRDLRRRLKSLSRQKIDAIFHAAAVSDFTFGKMFTRNPAGELEPIRRTRKIATRGGRLLVELQPTAKIIAELRGWYPHALLVGWKYEAEGKRADAVRAARKQLAACATDACVANGPAYGRGFGLVTRRSRQHFAERSSLFKALEQLL